MKKNILILSILFLPFVLFSQNKTIKINWGTAEKSNQSAFSTENKASNSNRKSATQLLDLLIDQEMLFVEQWQDIRLAEEGSLAVSDIVYEPLSTSEIKKIDRNLITDQHSYYPTFLLPRKRKS